MARKRKTPKPIVRRIEVMVSGRKVKTIRNRIALKGAVRECGEDRFFTKGDKVRFSRRVNRVLRVVFTYEAVESLITDEVYTTRVDTQAAALIARHGMVG